MREKNNYKSTLDIPWDLEKKTLYKPIKYKLRGTIYMELILWMYDLIILHSVELKPQQKITCLIYAIYFICWSYILIISLPTFNIFELIELLNKSWLSLGDPFRGKLLIHDLNEK